MNPRLLIENSTVKERAAWFREAYRLARTEYGELDDTSKLNIQSYVYGEKELNVIERIELKRFQNDYGVSGSGKMPYWDNKLNIANKRYLKRACCSIITIELMKLDAEPAEAFDWECFKSIHRRLYKKLFDWGGEIRNVNYEQAQEILENEVFKFTEFEEIRIKIENTFNRMDKLIDRNNIEKALVIVFDQLGITEWEQMTMEEQLAELLSCIGKLWNIHPFLHGNVLTELYFIIKFCDEHGYPCDRKTILEYANEDMLLRKCIVLAFYEPNWLAKIILLSITRNAEETLKQEQENKAIKNKISIAQMENIVNEGKNKRMAQMAQSQQANKNENEN